MNPKEKQSVVFNDNEENEPEQSNSQMNSTDENTDSNEFNLDLPNEMIEYINAKNNFINQIEQNYQNNIRLKNPQKFLFEMNRNERLWSMKCNQEQIDAILITKNGYQEVKQSTFGN